MPIKTRALTRLRCDQNQSCNNKNKHSTLFLLRITQTAVTTLQKWLKTSASQKKTEKGLYVLGNVNLQLVSYLLKSWCRNNHTVIYCCCIGQCAFTTLQCNLFWPGRVQLLTILLLCWMVASFSDSFILPLPHFQPAVRNEAKLRRPIQIC